MAKAVPVQVRFSAKELLKGAASFFLNTHHKELKKGLEQVILKQAGLK